MKNLILTLLFICSLISINAQETAILTINYSPQNIVLRIDDTEVISLKDKPVPYAFSLTTGTHKIEAWVKGFEIQEYEVKISSKEVNQLNIGMNKLNPEFQAYLDTQDKYTESKVKGVAIIGITTILAGSTSLLLVQGNNKEGNLFNNLENAKAEYSGAINDFELSSAEERHKKALNAIKGRRIFGLLSGGLTVGGIISAVRFSKKKTKAELELPVYEEKNPFVFHNYQKKNKGKLSLNLNGLVLNF